MWQRLCGGCHLNRATLAIASAAGIDIERVAPHLHGNILIIEARRNG
jgi:hypothetical protein